MKYQSVFYLFRQIETEVTCSTYRDSNTLCGTEVTPHEEDYESFAQRRPDRGAPRERLEWPWVHGWDYGTHIGISNAGVVMMREWNKSELVNINGDEYAVFLMKMVLEWNTENPRDRIEEGYVDSSSEDN